MIESFPYDITELGTYSQLSDMKERTVARDVVRSKWMSQVPDQVGVSLAENMQHDGARLTLVACLTTQHLLVLAAHFTPAARFHVAVDCWTCAICCGTQSELVFILCVGSVRFVLSILR